MTAAAAVRKSARRAHRSRARTAPPAAAKARPATTASTPSAAPPADPRPGTDASRAVAALLDEHGGKIRALALRMCGNAADAEDMVQEAFLQAFRRWHTFRGESSPGTWLYAIASRSCKGRLRRKGGVNRAVPTFSQLLPWSETQVTSLAASGEDSTQQAERAEAIAGVQREIARLPEHFRVPLVLKEVLGLPVEDAARALGLKPDTIKTRVHRARLMLRKALLRKSERTAATPPAYEKQVCLDLLQTKLAAMDRGREESFAVTQSELCNRCRAIFAELDLVQDACADMAEGGLPPQLRAAIVRALGERGAAETPARGRGRRPVRG